MKYEVHMVDVPLGGSPTVVIPDEAEIIGPWQNPQAKNIGIVYLLPAIEEEEDKGGEEKDKEE